jgi:(Z)-2-((N-methylformamido)methylene)-5-hydroxybutyrolactone dehydrogenase
MAVDLSGRDGLPRYDRLYIGGQWCSPADGTVIDTIDPSCGKPWARVALGGGSDIDLAVDAARTALAGPWGRMAGWERAAILRRLAELYSTEVDRLAELETRDSGRALRETRLDVGIHARWYQWFASLADKSEGRTIPIDETVHAFTTKVPVGVVGAITPWNAPLLTACWKVGAALAAGCTVVLKPSELTAVTSLELARIAEAAGVPPGVLNVVPGRGSDAGARMVAHEGVNKISFTGSGATASRMLRDGADTMKRFTFELGGKAAHILFADADLEPALNAAISSAWVNCGQACALGSRVLVERPIYQQVVDTFRARAGRVRVGLPLDEATHMGPQGHAQQLAKTLDYIGIARDEGAELIAGGHRLEGDLAEGYFVAPTVFAGVSNAMRVAREEIFGPVATIIPFDSEDEAIAIANDSKFGLTAGLWTRDVGRALRVSRQIEAGMVWVNTYRFIRWSTPYGGFKASGWGRENGTDALDAYQETRTTIIGVSGQYPDAYAS